jgi:uncharacterized protein
MRFFAAASLMAVFLVPSIAQSQTIQINRENKTIAISTTDEATSIADLAGITIGFEVYGVDSGGTYSEAGKLSQAILEALHKAGIKDESIESAAQGLQRNTEFDDKAKSDERAKKQFVFRQSWTVSSTSAAAAEVIRVAIAAGANQSGAIEWRLSERKELQAKAAENALVKARAVAQQMADGLHVRLGPLIYASNETPDARISFKRPADTPYLDTENATVAVTVPKLEIRPQTVREEATVYAVFAIE